MKQCIVYVKYLSDIRDHFICKSGVEPIIIDKKSMVLIGNNGEEIIDLGTVSKWDRRLVVDVEYKNGKKESYYCNIDVNPEIIVEKILIIETDQGHVEIKLKDIKEWERIYKEMKEDKTINVGEE